MAPPTTTSATGPGQTTGCVASRRGAGGDVSIRPLQPASPRRHRRIAGTGPQGPAALRRTRASPVRRGSRTMRRLATAEPWSVRSQSWRHARPSQARRQVRPRRVRRPCPQRTPLESCVVSGEVPVKATVPGLYGTLTVPKNRYSSPQGRQIALRVAVVPALAATPAPDPLFAIAGGSGRERARSSSRGCCPATTTRSTRRATSCASISAAPAPAQWCCRACRRCPASRPPVRTRRWRRGRATGSQRSTGTHGSSQARSRPRTSRPSGSRSATTGSTFTAPRTAGHSRSTTCASTPTASVRRSPGRRYAG